jgi:hypothetical protein
LWSYKTALALAQSDPSADLEYPELIGEVELLSPENPDDPTSLAAKMEQPIVEISEKVTKPPGESRSPLKKPEIYGVHKFWRRGGKNEMSLISGTWLQIKCKREDGKLGDLLGTNVLYTTNS